MRALRGPGRVVVVVFVAMSTVAVLEAVSACFLLRYLHHLASGGSADRVWAQAIDQEQAWLRWLHLAVFVLCALSFLVWFYRANLNLHLARLKGLPDTPVSALLAFLVPLVNLVMPFRVMRMLWMGSKYLAGARDVESWRAVRPSLRIPAWWGLFLASGLLMNLSVRMAGVAKDLSRFRWAAWTHLTADVLTLAAALLAVSLVREITADQEEARIRLAAEKRPSLSGLAIARVRPGS